MVGAEVLRKEGFTLSLNSNAQQRLFAEGCFFKDEKAGKYIPDRLMQRNEFVLNKGNMVDMKYFIIPRVMETIFLEEKDCPAVTSKMPKVGEKVDINCIGSIDGFYFTIKSAEKRLFKQEHKYQVNNEELGLIIEFDNLPENVNINLTLYFGQSVNYGLSVKDIKRSPDGKVQYEYVFRNDSGAITPSTSNFLDNTELEMKIVGCTIMEDVNWRFELK